MRGLKNFTPRLGQLRESSAPRQDPSLSFQTPWVWRYLDPRNLPKKTKLEKVVGIEIGGAQSPTRVGALPVISIWATYKSTYRGYNPSYPSMRLFLGFTTTRAIITSPPCSHPDCCSYYQLWLAVSGGFSRRRNRPICRRRLVGMG